MDGENKSDVTPPLDDSLRGKKRQNTKRPRDVRYKFQIANNVFFLQNNQQNLFRTKLYVVFFQK